MSREGRLIAELMLQNLTEDEWQHKLLAENVFQVSSGRTAVRYARTLRLRLSMLDEQGLQLIANGSERQRQQALLVALCLQSPIIAQFISQVVNDARRQFRETLPANVWMTFVDDQLRVHPELTGFSESSLMKMGNNVLKALSEAGYLDTPRRRNLQTVYLLEEIQALLARLEQQDLISVLEGKQ